MVDEDIGCCATLQKWLIFIVNLVLFIFGAVQIGVAVYIMAAGTENLDFASEVMDGNDTSVKCMLAFGIIVFFISFLGCCGAKKECKGMLWTYAVVLFFMIMGQAMTVALLAVSVKYGDSIFESLWKELSDETISDIETTYECCSFNGDDSDETWAADVTEWDTCSAANSWDPMETCWGKFESKIDDNYDMVKIITAIFLGVQTVIYFSAHFVIQSIAEAEGVEKEQGAIEISGGAPRV